MKKVSINELMGYKGSEAKNKKLSLDQLFEVLGERAPKKEFTPVGRLRLITSLRNRFGDNYKSLPGIEEAMKEFDENAEFAVKLQQMKMIGKR